MTVQTTIRIPEVLYEKIKQEAERKGVSVNALVLDMLWRRMEK